MQNANDDVDIEMNSIKGKLITTGTTQTSTTTMSGFSRTRRMSKLPLTTVDSSNLSNLMRLNRPKEELIFGPPMKPHFVPLKTPYSTIWQPSPALPSGPPAPPPGPHREDDQNYDTRNQNPPISTNNVTLPTNIKREHNHIKDSDAVMSPNKDHDDESSSESSSDESRCLNSDDGSRKKDYKPQIRRSNKRSKGSSTNHVNQPKSLIPESSLPNNDDTKKKNDSKEQICSKILSRTPSSSSGGLLLFNDKNDSTIIDFGNAIRSGSIHTITDIIENNGTDIMSKCDIKIEVSFRLLKSSRSHCNAFKYGCNPDLMWMSPFHLAIIARQSEIVQVMLESLVANNVLSSENELKNILSHTTCVKFTNGTPKDYFYADRSMDGISAIHLAAMFHAKSLMVIIRLLKSLDFLESMKDIFEAPDPHMKQTPLHFATRCSNPMSSTLLLICGVDIEAKNVKGFTALHEATKKGSEGHMINLLEYGANPNVDSEVPTESFGRKLMFHKCPLHRARNQKAVHNLLKYGADPNARMVEVEHNEKQLSVMDVFLKRYPQAICEIFNNGIKTNDQELDSVDLQIIFDFEFFFKEGFEKYPLDAEAEQDLNVCKKKIGAINEMAAHSKIVEYNRQDLLKHPLAEAYLHLKWQLIQKYFYFNMFLYACFVLTLTAFATVQAEMFQCHNDHKIFQMVACGNYNKLTLKSDFNQSFNFNFLTIVEEHIKAQDGWLNQKGWLFIVLGILSIIGFSLIAIREFWQAKSYWKHYINSGENWFEILILISGIAYFVSLMINPLYSIHFGAWVVWLSWIELVLMLGRIPSIGIFIYMSIYVVKTLSVFLVVYFPLFLAFAATFHILLPNRTSFSTLPSSLIKTITMMTGEFDLDDYFQWDTTKEDFGHVSGQMFYLIFLVFVSIVIANLLIGLTVSKTEDLFKEAGAVRLEKTVDQVAGIEAIFQSQSQESWLNPLFWLKKVNQKGKLFEYLASLRKSYQASPWKVCVLPHSQQQLKTNANGRQFLNIKGNLESTSSSSFDSGYNVYVYDDDEGCFHEPKLDNLYIPAWVIGKVLMMLKDQETNSEKLHNSQDNDNNNEVSSLEHLEDNFQKKMRHRSGVISPPTTSAKPETRRISNELNKVAESLSMPILASPPPAKQVNKLSRKISTTSAFDPILEELDKSSTGNEGPIPYIEEQSLDQRLHAIEMKLTAIMKSLPKTE